MQSGNEKLHDHDHKGRIPHNLSERFDHKMPPMPSADEL